MTFVRKPAWPDKTVTNPTHIEYLHKIFNPWQKAITFRNKLNKCFKARYTTDAVKQTLIDQKLRSYDYSHPQRHVPSMPIIWGIDVNPIVKRKAEGTFRDNREKNNA